MKKIVFSLFILLSNFIVAQQPNVVLVMTDDQGYGDLAAHGNPWIKTPNLDKLHAESIRFTNFHVGTTCAPTRSMLMTGIHCNKTKVWHTVKSRSLLKKGVPTIADTFKKGGYTTGIFGKWHLGDNYPFRPQDRGFDTAVVHGAGGIGQSPDFWLNDYFDDTYLANGVPKKYKGYCTDVFFEEAINFIDASKKEGKPFFCYVATNAPHGPLNVAEKYRAMYEHLEGKEIPAANFYGMITNVDENIAKLRGYLKEHNLSENTIFIYMTDNGTSYGYGGKKKLGFNAGMQGKKSSQYEGGHRVPFFLHWPKKNLTKGKDINSLTVVRDILPTLSSLCGLKSPKKIDGKDISDLIFENENTDLDTRIEVVDTQRMDKLVYEKQFAVMQGDWRLVGKKLFNLKEDKGQSNDIATKYPEKTKELREFYNEWWKTLDAENLNYERIILDTKKEENVYLSVHDQHPRNPEMYNVKTQIPYNQNYVRKGIDYEGEWSLKNCGKKNYVVSLRRWPRESNLKINQTTPAVAPYCKGCSDFWEGKNLKATKATLIIGDQVYTKEVSPNDTSIDFDVKIRKGDFEMSATFQTIDGSFPAYYVYVK